MHFCLILWDVFLVDVGFGGWEIGFMEPSTTDALGKNLFLFLDNDSLWTALFWVERWEFTSVTAGILREGKLESGDLSMTGDSGIDLFLFLDRDSLLTELKGLLGGVVF